VLLYERSIPDAPQRQISSAQRGIIKHSRISTGPERHRHWPRAASSTLAHSGIINEPGGIDIGLERHHRHWPRAASSILTYSGIVNEPGDISISPAASTSSPQRHHQHIRHATDIAITRNPVKVLFKLPNHPRVHTEGP
jgi:hypothetical protein